MLEQPALGLATWIMGSRGVHRACLVHAQHLPSKDPEVLTRVPHSPRSLRDSVPASTGYLRCQL